jgi:hypothetical protein
VIEVVAVVAVVAVIAVVEVVLPGPLDDPPLVFYSTGEYNLLTQPSKLEIRKRKKRKLM